MGKVHVHRGRCCVLKKCMIPAPGIIDNLVRNDQPAWLHCGTDAAYSINCGASEMFQELLADIRSLVISRVFASRPRRIQLTLTDTSENPEPVQVQPKGQTQSDGKKKKKRRRHKK